MGTVSEMTALPVSGWR